MRAAVVPLAIWTVFAPIDVRAQTPSPAPLASYRTRILGVFDSQSGEPIEGAEVIDVFAHVTAVTTKTGTVSLAFLPEGGSMLRIQKIGFKPVTQVVEISPADTVSITVLMEARRRRCPPSSRRTRRRCFCRRDARVRRTSKDRPWPVHHRGRATEERQPVADERRPPERHGGELFAKNADSMLRRQSSDWRLGLLARRLLRRRTRHRRQPRSRADPHHQIGAVEVYASTPTVPAEYNKTGKGCGVMLLWSRFR